MTVSDSAEAIVEGSLTESTVASGDTTLPTASIFSPLSGTTYITSQTVIISATASDNIGISKVEFYDGATLKFTDTVYAYTYSWPISSSLNGTHSWTVKAYDAAGNIKVSPSVSLVVNIPPALPATPTLTSGACEPNLASMSWTVTPLTGITDYHIERCTGTTCSAFTQIATNTASPYISTGLTNDTTYRYRVRSHNHATALYSPYSNIFNVTPCPISYGNGITLSGSRSCLTLKADLSWTAITGQSVYLLGWCTNNCTNPNAVANKSIVGLSDSAFSILGTNSYKFRVQTTDGLKYSNVMSFPQCQN